MCAVLRAKFLVLTIGCVLYFKAVQVCCFTLPPSPFILYVPQYDLTSRSTSAPCLKGTCVNFLQCPYSANLLQNSPILLPLHIVEILRQNECGFDGGGPKFCCSITIPSEFNPDSVEPSNSDITNHPNLGLLPQTDCGQSKITDSLRITAGSEATLMEFPWMALLGYDSINNPDFRCGGTVINSRHVLTAAHCIVDLNLIGVRLGEHNLNNQTDCDPSTGICSPSVQNFLIEKAMVHPNYKIDTSENDIGLVRLAGAADFSHDNVQPVCLPLSTGSNINLVGKFASVAGWGVTENGKTSPELRKASVPVVPIQNCQNVYKNFGPVTYKQICAGGQLGIDSCSGDSGGPLQYHYTHSTTSTPHYIQYGIVSYGSKYCGKAEQPAVYTNVIHYLKWILDNLEPTQEHILTIDF